MIIPTDINTPADIRRLIIQLLHEILENKTEIPQAGAVSNLIGQFLRAWEMETTSDIEKRIAILEAHAKRGQL
ncbi:MAG TPA: hypothetical protein PLA21_07340 [Rectinema sp.]|nr:hypothetical protein [Rectinema sp.]